MSKKEKKIIKLHPKMCSPEECEHCMYIGEGRKQTPKESDGMADLEKVIKSKEEAQETPQPHPCEECNEYRCDVHCPYYGK